jgi:hypothetical protein
MLTKHIGYALVLIGLALFAIAFQLVETRIAHDNAVWDHNEQQRINALCRPHNWYDPQ